MPKYNHYTIFDAYPESEKIKMMELVEKTRSKYDKKKEISEGIGNPMADKQKAGGSKHVLETDKRVGKRTVQPEKPIEEVNQINLF